MRPPLLHRLLVLWYPRGFREEFEDQLLLHLGAERQEPRYQGLAGGLRFLARAGWDAAKEGAGLRWESAREGWARRWRGSTSARGSLSVYDLRGGEGGMRTAFEGVARDIRHAVRGLAKNPAYALVFVVTLGLGIGANTAMFSAVNGVLLRPLPHQDGDRLVYLRHSARLAGLDNVLFSVPEIDDYRRSVPSLASVAEFSAMDFTMLGYDAPRRVRVGIVSGNYFPVVGLSATRGRLIGPEDDGETAPAVIVLSDAYWRSTFGGDPDILGTTVEINGRTATFVGVAEPAPPYPERTDVYVNMAASPHHLGASMNHDRIHRMTEVFARLSPGSSVASAQTEVDAVSARIQADHPEAYDAGSGFGVSVTPLKTQLTARARPTLLLLLGTATLVLVIACANLANLTLTRVLRRGHEMAIRASLGGGRGRLRRELLVESLVLAGAGAALGLLLAYGSLGLLVSFAARFTSRASEIALSGSVFAFALLVAVGASVFFTLLPTLPNGDQVAAALTRAGTRTTVSTRARRAQRGLVMAQIGTSFVLLMGAGLLLRTMIHLNRVDPGFDAGAVLTMDIPANTAGRTPDQLRSHYLSVLEDVRTVPGVETAALTNVVPLAEGIGGLQPNMEITVDGFEPQPGAPAPRADFRVVSPDFFAAMGIDVRAGRPFTSTDVEDAQPVVIINEAMAERYFGARDPVGQRIAWTDEVIRFLGIEPEFRTVVGVVADTRDAGLDSDVPHVVYNPYPQVRWASSLVVRIAPEPAAVLPEIRRRILTHDPNQPIDKVATMAELGSASVAPRRLNAILLGGFAVLALIIASVGVGGVLAFSVGSRIREFGVRSALGAARHQVWSSVVVEGARLALAGIALGGIAALFLSRYISSLLVGVPPLDPVTFVAVGLLLGLVAVGAAWAPAWRAARVSPVEALGSE